MNDWRSRLAYDTRVYVTALLAGAPGVITALILLWVPEHAFKTQLTATVIILAVWLGLCAAIRTQVVRPLQTIANLLAAVREGDFSVRGRAVSADDDLQIALGEINNISAILCEQRLGAIEASTLLDKVMLEIDVAIFAFDDQDQLRLVNRAGERLLGRSPGRLLGETADVLGMASLLEGEPARRVEVPFAGASAHGQGLWELRRTSFRQHGVAHALIVLTDLHRALREEERQAWQRLVRVLGHEINNSLAPITSIASNLRRLVEAAIRPDDWETDLAEGLAVVERRADSLARFMAAYARLAKLPPPRVGRVDVEQWIRRVAPLDTRARVTINPGPPLTVLGDGDQLDQLLINLLRNAVEAALETGGAVTVGWNKQGPSIEVTVTDDGPGIAETRNLFIPFFTTKPNGSGIGLVLSRQIAEAHHGSLDLRDRQVPRGCVATLRLPL